MSSAESGGAQAAGALLEWIIDAGEDRGAFAAPSDIDEADYERLRDSAESDAADRMQILENGS